jgi:hypothetical protein
MDQVLLLGISTNLGTHSFLAGQTAAGGAAKHLLRLNLLLVSFVIYTVGFLFVLIHAPRFWRKTSPFGQAIIFAGVCMALYVTVFPLISQELGGLRPRCAYLDLFKDKISDETSEALGPVLKSPGGPKNENVVQAGPVDVLFSGTDFMLVDPHSRRYVRIRPGHLEIKRDMIETVEWCG